MNESEGSILQLSLQESNDGAGSHIIANTTNGMNSLSSQPLTTSALAALYSSPVYFNTLALFIKRELHTLLTPIKSSSLNLHHITVGLVSC